jgi:hypothetical protein
MMMFKGMKFVGPEQGGELLLAIIESALDQAIQQEEKKMNKIETKKAPVSPKVERALNIFELSQLLTEGQTARSTRGNLVVTKNGEGLVNAKTLEFLPFTTEIINMAFTLEPERIMVPAAIAIEAYRQGKSIELDYLDSTSLFVPGKEEGKNPNVSMDAITHGVFYVVK